MLLSLVHEVWRLEINIVLGEVVVEWQMVLIAVVTLQIFWCEALGLCAHAVLGEGTLNSWWDLLEGRCFLDYIYRVFVGNEAH